MHVEGWYSCFNGEDVRLCCRKAGVGGLKFGTGDVLRGAGLEGLAERCGGGGGGSSSVSGRGLSSGMTGGLFCSFVGDEDGV